MAGSGRAKSIPIQIQDVQEGGCMIVGVPREIYPKERRVGLVPAAVSYTHLTLPTIYSV